MGGFSGKLLANSLSDLISSHESTIPQMGFPSNTGGKEDFVVRYFAFAIRRAFSAVDAASRRSSIVAMNVANLPSNRTSVITALPSWRVLTVNPSGAALLSGTTAFVTADAIAWSGYSSRIVAWSKFFASQLSANEFVCRDDKFFCPV